MRFLRSFPAGHRLSRLVMRGLRAVHGTVRPMAAVRSAALGQWRTRHATGEALEARSDYGKPPTRGSLA